MGVRTLRSNDIWADNMGYLFKVDDFFSAHDEIYFLTRLPIGPENGSQMFLQNTVNSPDYGALNIRMP
jgi:hypothetical protein